MGWIKLDRKLLDHWLWKDKPFSRGQAWVDLILQASHKDNFVVVDGSKIGIEAGSLVTSLRRLGDRWGWSYNKVDHFLKLLENEKMLTQKRDTKKTVITLENYGIFQHQRTQPVTQKGHGWGSDGDQMGTFKNNKEYIKNKKEESGYAAVSPPGMGEQELEALKARLRE